jgi:integrase
MEKDEKSLEPANEASSDPKGEANEEAKRQAMRKRKPLGPVVKPLSIEEIEQLLRDPEINERDHLLDALPKGNDADNQDDF